MLRVSRLVVSLLVVSSLRRSARDRSRALLVSSSLVLLFSVAGLLRSVAVERASTGQGSRGAGERRADETLGKGAQGRPSIQSDPESAATSSTSRRVGEQGRSGRRLAPVVDVDSAATTLLERGRYQCATRLDRDGRIGSPCDDAKRNSKVAVFSKRRCVAAKRGGTDRLGYRLGSENRTSRGEYI